MTKKIIKRSLGQIEPYIEKDKHRKHLPSPLFDTRTMNILWAKRNRGKTTAIESLIKNDLLKLKIFDEISVVSPSHAHDKIWNAIKEHHSDDVTFYSNHMSLLQIIEEQKLLSKTFVNEHLLIVDDISHETNKKFHDAIKWLSVQGRHYQFTVLVTCHNSKVFKPIIRENVDNYFIFRTNRTQLESIATALCGERTVGEWVKMMLALFRQIGQYDFIRIDDDNAYYRNWCEPLKL